MGLMSAPPVPYGQAVGQPSLFFAPISGGPGVQIRQTEISTKPGLRGVSGDWQEPEPTIPKELPLLNDKPNSKNISLPNKATVMISPNNLQIVHHHVIKVEKPAPSKPPEQVKPAPPPVPVKPPPEHIETPHPNPPPVVVKEEESNEDSDQDGPRNGTDNKNGMDKGDEQVDEEERGENNVLPQEITDVPVKETIQTDDDEVDEDEFPMMQGILKAMEIVQEQVRSNMAVDNLDAHSRSSSSEDSAGAEGLSLESRPEANT
jgi:hypothetical protein